MMLFSIIFRLRTNPYGMPTHNEIQGLHMLMEREMQTAAKHRMVDGPTRSKMTPPHEV